MCSPSMRSGCHPKFAVDGEPLHRRPRGPDADDLTGFAWRCAPGRTARAIGRLTESAPTPANLSRRGKCRENSTHTIGCSAEQALAFLPQTPENARLGDQDRVYRQTEGSGHFGGRPLLENQEAEAIPGGRGEFRLYQFREAPDDEFVVLAVAEPAKLAFGVFELGEAVVKTVDGPRSARPPIVAEPVGGDRADPEPEGPGSTIVIEIAQIAGEHEQHLLRQVVGVGLRCVVLLQPAAD